MATLNLPKGDNEANHSDDSDCEGDDENEEDSRDVKSPSDTGVLSDTSDNVSIKSMKCQEVTGKQKWQRRLIYRSKKSNS